MFGERLTLPQQQCHIYIPGDVYFPPQTFRGYAYSTTTAVVRVLLIVLEVNLSLSTRPATATTRRRRCCVHLSIMDRPHGAIAGLLLFFLSTELYGFVLGSFSAEGDKVITRSHLETRTIHLVLSSFGVFAPQQK